MSNTLYRIICAGPESDSRIDFWSEPGREKEFRELCLKAFDLAVIAETEENKRREEAQLKRWKEPFGVREIIPDSLVTSYSAGRKIFCDILEAAGFSITPPYSSGATVWFDYFDSLEVARKKIENPDYQEEKHEAE